MNKIILLAIVLAITGCGGGSTSPPVMAIVNNLPSGDATITGNPIEGETLTASNSLQDADGLGDISYQWYADASLIADATFATLILTPAHVGAAITVKAFYTDNLGFEDEKTSVATELVTVSLANRTQAIAANDAIMALLLKDGSVKTWGDNTFGIMGHIPGTNGDTEITDYAYNPNAATIANLTDVKSIAVGYHFILALKTDGTVWAWGRNENGELGHEPGTSSDGTISDGNPGDYDGDGFKYYNPIPSQVSGLTNVTAISANNASAAFALKDDGTVWAWGNNYAGQLGDNGESGDQSFTPVQVKDSAGTGTLSDIIAVYASYYGTFASEFDGTLWAWGVNTGGKLGLGDNTNKLIPVQHSLTNVVDIALSGQLSAALKTDGTVFYWGDGVSTPIDRGLVGVAEIAAAGDGVIALLANGTAMAWGKNTSGKLGDGTIVDIANPTAIFAGDTLVDVAMGELFSAALLDDGSVKTWGGNGYGQLGHAPNSNGDVQPVTDGYIYNLAGVTITDAVANTLVAPAAFMATFSSNVIVSWTAVAGADSYNVYWATTPDVNTLTGTKIESVTSGSALQSLAAGQRYHLMVTAVDASGNESIGSLEAAVIAPL
jgi:alpha-tubulin suppressor-like RCC1 family protein